MRQLVGIVVDRPVGEDSEHRVWYDRRPVDALVFRELPQDAPGLVAEVAVGSPAGKVVTMPEQRSLDSQDPLTFLSVPHDSPPCTSVRARCAWMRIAWLEL